METMCLWVYMLLLLVQYPTGFSLLNNNSTMNQLCHKDESNLLLQFKQHLSPPSPDRYYKTKYWKASRDCCLWDGVTCDHFTGHVIALDLSHNYDPDGNTTYLTGKLKSNSSLFHLTHLNSLNLAFNDFKGSAIPSEFGRLNALTHLNLSQTNFAGKLPMEFYHLSNLLSLDLSRGDAFYEIFPWEFYTSNIRCDLKTVFRNMTRLRVLVLANQNLSGSALPMNMSSLFTHLDLGNTELEGNLPANIFEIPNLQFLSLSNNFALNGSLPKSLNWSNVHSINRLDLGWTNISGTLPDSIGFMTNLNYMDLAYCQLSGPIPESIGNISAITILYLPVNKFSGKLPSTISNLRRLTDLVLSYNQLEGQLPDIFSGFQSLRQLDLRYNYFEGQIPSSLTNMSRLERLSISANSLAGPFPSTAGHGLKDLWLMKFSDNSIQGTIPPWLFSLPSLEILSVSYNNLTGGIGKLNSQTLRRLDLSSNELNIELQSFYNLSSMESLLISHNTVIEHHVGDIVNVTYSNLTKIEMLSCGIKEFPNFFRSGMPNLESLDLSINNIHGPIPDWFISNPLHSLNSLNLSYNFLTSARDLPLQGLEYLDLRSNSLWGTFPPSICNMSQLSLLDLSHNKLSGNILECLVNSSTRLEILDLRRNEFYGKIPTSIGGMQYLANLELNQNHFQGPLPPSLANCTDLQAIDLGNNMIHDTFPWWLHTLPLLRILILKNNSFHGSITSPAFTNNSFIDLRIFDLSYNNFTGPLPENLFASLEAMKDNREAPEDNDGSLYMRMGRGFFNIRPSKYMYSVTITMKGADTDLAKVLRFFGAIDLSCNNFHGSIPHSLPNLTYLRLLNMSHNSIDGSIPPALSRMTLLEQLDLSSNELTGSIPQTLINLTFLGALNLSHNHLVGPIPQGNQFLTFSNESFVGNSGLCGAPLTRRCGNEPGEFEEEEEDEDDGFMMGFTWKVVVIGYGCGIVLGFILGSVMLYMEKPRWLLRFVYVEAAIILSRRKRKGRR